jgi:hypothetical protein
MKLNLSLFHIQNTRAVPIGKPLSLLAQSSFVLCSLFFLPYTFQIHLGSPIDKRVQLLNEKSIIFGKIKTLDQVYLYTSRSCSKTRSSL